MVAILKKYKVLLFWAYLGAISLTVRLFRWCRVWDMHKIKLDLAAQGIFQKEMHEHIREQYKIRLLIAGTTLLALGILLTVMSMHAFWVWFILVPVFIVILAIAGKPEKPEPVIVETPHVFPRTQQPVPMSRAGRFDPIDSAALALHQQQKEQEIIKYR
jgi:Na+-transporting methylmalonyl-CoA/oxaloacetate decarboxylase gamma subunit